MSHHVVFDVPETLVSSGPKFRVESTPQNPFSYVGETRSQRGRDFICSIIIHGVSIHNLQMVYGSRHGPRESQPSS